MPNIVNLRNTVKEPQRIIHVTIESPAVGPFSEETNLLIYDSSSFPGLDTRFARIIRFVYFSNQENLSCKFFYVGTPNKCAITSKGDAIDIQGQNGILSDAINGNGDIVVSTNGMTIGSAITIILVITNV